MSPEEYKAAVELRRAEGIEQRHYSFYCTYRNMQYAIKQAGLRACLPIVPKNSWFSSTVFVLTADGIRFRRSLPRIDSVVLLHSGVRAKVCKVKAGEYYVVAKGVHFCANLSDIAEVLKW